ncbi:MAG: ABC transporter ATP-binding protein/permease [Oscillospiraceae bacterium]|jgi:ABC-type multidrug transport system fused ATPase/permease subunit|nr:ABC transporter ATP-binding protein/permease [Oscillospiraceae bacterium]
MNTQKLNFTESVKIFGKALKVSIKARGATSIIVSLLGFAMAFLPMLISLSVRKFSDEVQNLYGRSEALVANVIGVFVILSVLYIVQLLWNSLNSYFENRNAIKIRQFMKERIMRCTCDVKYKYIENYDDFKQRINFVGTDAGERVANSVGTTISWVQSIITFVSIIAVLWAVDFWIVVILVAACIPAILIAAKFSEDEYRNKGFWILEYLMACAYFFEATMSQSLNDTRFFGAFPWLKRKFTKQNAEYIKIKNRVTRKHVLWNSIADIFRSCVYVFILLITARQIFDNPTVGIGAFMLVFTMASQLQDVTAKIFIAAAQFVSDAAYMRDFFYLDNLDYEKRDKNASPREKFDVDFKDVNFTYPNIEREILHNLNVHIKEGEKVAIVGENGSGKSTFVNLLCALYEPNSGAITMGGEDIHTHLSKTRKTLSAVFQDFAKYEASIRENITVSDRSSADGELENLCKKTGAWEFIKTQPAGIDEIVGSFSASGNNLSGGQWQKIALTRCAYRENAKIMVLDEPTAALDPLAEADLYRSFSDLTGDRTTILISHRLGITQLVDRILVFDEGRIVEDGDHKTLLSNGGLYAKMYQAQAQWYE